METWMNLLKACCLFLALMTIGSQQIHAQQAEIGLKFGPVLTAWSGTAFDIGLDYQNRFAIFGGVHVKVPFSKIVSFETGIDITAKGFKLEGSIDEPEFSLSGEATNRSIYGEVPILFNIGIGNTFYFVGGAQAAFLLSNNFKVELENVAGGTDEADTKEFLNDFDINAVLGFGLTFQSGFDLTLTFEQGLTNVVAVSPYATWDEAKNRVIRLGMGIYFNRKKK